MASVDDDGAPQPLVFSGALYITPALSFGGSAVAMAMVLDDSHEPFTEVFIRRVVGLLDT